MTQLRQACQAGIRDEVLDPRRRRTVVDLVTDFFSLHQGNGNKCVLTSRSVGYPEVRLRVEVTLVDLVPAGLFLMGAREHPWRSQVSLQPDPNP